MCRTGLTFCKPFKDINSPREPRGFSGKRLGIVNTKGLSKLHNVFLSLTTIIWRRFTRPWERRPGHIIHARNGDLNKKKIILSLEVMVGHGVESCPSKTVLDSGFHTVDFGFRIRIVSWFPRSLGCIPDSKVQDFGVHKQNFSNSGIRSPLHRARNGKETVSDDLYTTKTYRAPQIIQLNPRWYCRNN